MKTVRGPEVAKGVSADDVAFYNENGYWCSPKLFDDDTIAGLRDAQERHWRGECDTGAVSWIQQPLVPADPASTRIRFYMNGWWVNRTFREVVLSPLLGAIAARLMDTSEVRLWHDQILWKPGLGHDTQSGAGNIGWHQDFGGWQCCGTVNLCTAGVALQDTDLTNGCMRVIRGSHKWGTLPNSMTYHSQDLEALKQRYSAGRDWDEVPLEVGAGQVTFHHSQLLHGSGPNQTDSPRLTIVVHMQPADCAYSGDPAGHPNVMALGPDAKPGDLFTGSWFPRLWPAQA